MIPPLKEVRIRSITRWLQDQQESQLSPAALASRAESLDEQMLESFETAEDSLKTSMMKAGTWGTAEGMRSFPTDRMTLWQETTAQFLPLTTELQKEA